MRRLLAFALVLIVGLGCMGFVHARTFALEDQLTFTSRILEGDPAALAGMEASLSFYSHTHLRWNSRLPLDRPAASRTDFVFSQKPDSQPLDFGSQTEFRPMQGFGVQGFRLTDMDTELARIIRIVADETGADGEVTRVLHGREVLSAIPISYILDYTSPKVYCSMFYNATDALSLQSISESALDPDYLFWTKLNDAFRFPVPEDLSITVTVQKDPEGQICGFNVDFYYENGSYYDWNSCGFRFARNDSGLYLVPYCLDREGQPISGDYAAGMGVYRLPWKQIFDNTAQFELDGITYVTPLVEPDFSRMENILPLPEDSRIAALKVSEDSKTGYLIHSQEGQYRVTVLDLEHGSVRGFHPLMDCEDAGADVFCTVTDQWMLFSADGKLALMDLSRDAAPVLITDAGDRLPGMLNALAYADNPVSLSFEDGALTLGAVLDGEDQIFFVGIYDEAGPLVLAAYDSNLSPFYYNYNSLGVFPDFSSLKLQ